MNNCEELEKQRKELFNQRSLLDQNWDKQEQKYYLEKIRLFKAGVIINTHNIIEGDLYELLFEFERFYQEQQWLDYHQNEEMEALLRHAEEYYNVYENLVEQERISQEETNFYESEIEEIIERQRIEEENKENLCP